MTKDLLSTAYPEKAIEVVNVAGVSYAMHRVTLVFDEIARYDPDIVIVYSGHNEFVETAFDEKAKTESEFFRKTRFLASHLRLYGFLKKPVERYRDAEPSLRLDVDREFDRLFTNDQRRQIVGRYKAELGGLVRKAHAKGIRAVLCTVPCNLREWPPFKSHEFATSSEEDIQARNRWIREAAEALKRGDADGAIKLLNEVLAYRPGHGPAETLLKKFGAARPAAEPSGGKEGKSNREKD